jgi:hypothetical protein
MIVEKERCTGDCAASVDDAGPGFVTTTWLW